jgi:hypothetical protein
VYARKHGFWHDHTANLDEEEGEEVDMNGSQELEEDNENINDGSDASENAFEN